MEPVFSGWRTPGRERKKPSVLSEQIVEESLHTLGHFLDKGILLGQRDLQLFVRIAGDLLAC